MTTGSTTPPTHRATLLAMIPINLILVIWVWIGRFVFGVFGWFAFILLPVAVIVLVALILTTVLAFTQPGRPRSLTAWQFRWQWLTWLGLFAFGAFMPDFGDTDDSHISLLTQIFGVSDSLLNASYMIVLFSAVVVVVSWVGLLISLTAGRRQPPEME